MPNFQQGLKDREGILATNLFQKELRTDLKNKRTFSWDTEQLKALGYLQP